MIRKENELFRKWRDYEKKIRRLSEIREKLKSGSETVFNVAFSRSEPMTVICRRALYSKKTDAYWDAELLKSKLGKKAFGARWGIINHLTKNENGGFDIEIIVETDSPDTVDVPSEHEVRTVDFKDENASVICRKHEIEDACRALLDAVHNKSYTPTGAFCEIFYEDGTVEVKLPVSAGALLTSPFVINGELPPFENDPDVIGKWVLYDIIPSKEYFSCSKKYGMEKKDYVLDELYFLPEGEGYYLFRCWSRGVIYKFKRNEGISQSVTYRYELLAGEDGGEYMIVEYYWVRDENIVVRTDYAVYKKENSHAYKRTEIGRRDDMTHEFVNDVNVLGGWKVYDLIPDPESYDPKKIYYYTSALSVMSLHFYPDGNLQCKIGAMLKHIMLEWTCGMTYEPRDKLARKYMIKNIDGVEYLFWEWKTGDYIYSNKKPDYYVFVRVKNENG